MEEDSRFKKFKPCSVPLSVSVAINHKVSAVRRNIHEVLLPAKYSKLATINILRQRILEKYHSKFSDLKSCSSRDATLDLIPLYSSDERDRLFPAETNATIPIQTVSTYLRGISTTPSILTSQLPLQPAVIDYRLMLLPNTHAVIVAVNLKNPNK